MGFIEGFAKFLGSLIGGVLTIAMLVFIVYGGGSLGIWLVNLIKG